MNRILHSSGDSIHFLNEDDIGTAQLQVNPHKPESYVWDIFHNKRMSKEMVIIPQYYGDPNYGSSSRQSNWMVINGLIELGYFPPERNRQERIVKGWRDFRSRWDGLFEKSDPLRFGCFPLEPQWDLPSDVEHGWSMGLNPEALFDVEPEPTGAELMERYRRQRAQNPDAPDPLQPHIPRTKPNSLGHPTASCMMISAIDTKLEEQEGDIIEQARQAYIETLKQTANAIKVAANQIKPHNRKEDRIQRRKKMSILKHKGTNETLSYFSDDSNSKADSDPTPTDVKNSTEEKDATPVDISEGPFDPIPNEPFQRDVDTPVEIYVDELVQGETDKALIRRTLFNPHVGKIYPSCEYSHYFTAKIKIGLRDGHPTISKAVSVRVWNPALQKAMLQYMRAQADRHDFESYLFRIDPEVTWRHGTFPIVKHLTIAQR